MAKCKGCGAEIVWGVLGDKRIPLDPRPPVYTTRRGGAPPLSLDGGLRVDRVYDAMVSHFATCPKASEFSKGPKK